MIAIQRPIPIDDPPTIVLATVGAAREAIRGLDEDDVLALIESGDLVGWNIGLGSARTIRILRSSIEHYRKTLGSRPQALVDLDLVLTVLLAQHRGKPWIKSTTLALILNCSRTHVINLIVSKALTILPKTSWGVGPNGAALITVPSFNQFLQIRRIT